MAGGDIYYNVLSKQYGFHLVHNLKKAHAFAGIWTRISLTTI